jgi:hypothetical protein
MTLGRKKQLMIDAPDTVANLKVSQVSFGTVIGGRSKPP